MQYFYLVDLILRNITKKLFQHFWSKMIKISISKVVI
jgi:hypothetical protein